MEPEPDQSSPPWTRAAPRARAAPRQAPRPVPRVARDAGPRVAAGHAAGRTHARLRRLRRSGRGRPCSSSTASARRASCAIRTMASPPSSVPASSPSTGPASASRRASPNRRVTDWPRDVEELLDSLGIDRCAIVAWSGGGPYALACGWQMPERFSVLGLISAPGAALGRARQQRLHVAAPSGHVTHRGPCARGSSPWPCGAGLASRRRTRPSSSTRPSPAWSRPIARSSATPRCARS